LGTAFLGARNYKKKKKKKKKKAEKIARSFYTSARLFI